MWPRSFRHRMRERDLTLALRATVELHIAVTMWGARARDQGSITILDVTCRSRSATGPRHASTTIATCRLCIRDSLLWMSRDSVIMTTARNVNISTDSH